MLTKPQVLTQQYAKSPMNLAARIWRPSRFGSLSCVPWAIGIALARLLHAARPLAREGAVDAHGETLVGDQLAPQPGIAEVRP